VIGASIVVLLEAGFDSSHVTPGHDIVDKTVAAAIGKIGLRIAKFQEIVLKMFQTCGSATLSESERISNASEGSDDHPSVTLPLLPRDRYC
jgi:hypothetical protein